MSSLTDDAEPEGAYSLYNISNSKAEDPIYVGLTVNGFHVTMELDTGSGLTLINEETYSKIGQPNQLNPLEKASVILKTYTGQQINVLGTAQVVICYHGREEVLPVQVVEGVGPNLLGRDWIQQLKVSVDIGCNLVSSVNSNLGDLLCKHADVFKPELGLLTGLKAKLHVKSDAIPKFCRARTVPFALKKPVEVALQKMEEQGIISPIQFSSWAAPIVPVVKQVNPALQVDSYPIPRVEGLYASMSGGKCFTKLDLSQAYLQLQLDENSKAYVTINTHKGLFRYNRMLFGISSAPAIFQRCMENLLQGLNGVCVYFDDILITGSTLEEHLQNLENVLTKIEKAGLKLNHSKCLFLMSKIEYLGHVIDEHELHTTEDKIKAIKEAPRPKNVSELRAFIGIINYYGKCLPNLSSKLAPLYKLLQNHTKWMWSDSQEQAFQAAKQALQADTPLQ